MRRLKETAPAEQVLEVVTPRTNAARLNAAERLFGSLVLASGPAGRGEPVALEIAADAERRRFLVRTSSMTAQRRVARQLGTAYPQAGLRQFDAGSFPNGDPAQLGPDEQAAVTTLPTPCGRAPATAHAGGSRSGLHHGVNAG